MGILILIAIAAMYQYLESSYQTKADAIRIADVNHIASLVSKYHQATHRFPFQKESDEIGIMISVYIDGKSTVNIQESISPISERIYSYQKFVDELQSVLGNDAVVPMDPQKVPSFGPNWYVYSVQNGNYFIAAHLYHKNSNARYVESEGYYKYEISNIEVPEKKIYKYQD
ncbi:hypothetical protein H6770_00255 [Candidatus Peribacteria bacterium]|nr:hypothetical protein [Candidatus Peribacteria bacterium]